MRTRSILRKLRGLEEGFVKPLLEKAAEDPETRHCPGDKSTEKNPGITRDVITETAECNVVVLVIVF